MNNIRVKQESLNNWREEFSINEEIEGGISVQNVADGLNFTEVETVDIIKPEPIKGASNWQLEMAVESLISEGYNDDEIVTILTEELPKIPLVPIVTGAARAAWNLSTKGVKTAYELGKGVRSVVNRGVRDTKLTKDILDTAKKLRQPKLPQGVEVVKKGVERGGGIAKSFKGFMQNVKNRATKIRNSSKQEIQSTAKDVDVLGGAATTPKAPATKPMKNITPSSIGTKITNATDKIKVAGAAGAGAALGASSTKLSPSKVSTATPTPPVEKKVEAPITNDGKKTVDPSKNEKIDTSPTKRELRNQRNDALSSKEGKRARRDARLQKKKDSGFPSRRMKSGTPVNQLFNKEEVTTEGLLSKIAKISAAAWAANKAGEFLKTKGDEALDGARKNMKIGGDKRKSDIEKATGVKLDHYSWRDELGLIEGNRTRKTLGSGNKKDFSKGPNEKVFVDYTKIKANAPVKTDTKVG